MRHRNAGFKLGRNTSHRRALLRNLVTSVIIEDRVQTTVAKAKSPPRQRRGFAGSGTVDPLKASKKAGGKRK